VNTGLSTIDAVVGGVALIEAPIMTLTGAGLPGEDASSAHALSFDVVDSRPRASDRVGAAVYTFAKRVRGIGPVKAVAYATEGNVHLLWTFTSQRRKDVREQIYSEERKLMSDYPDLTFDFNVVSLDRLADRPLLPDDIHGQLVYYRGGQ